MAHLEGAGAAPTTALKDIGPNLAFRNAAFGPIRSHDSRNACNGSNRDARRDGT